MTDTPALPTLLPSTGQLASLTQARAALYDLPAHARPGGQLVRAEGDQQDVRTGAQER